MVSAFTLPHSYTKRAFSLVELSIVLVILGLLVGGILSGKHLIRSATIREGFKEAEHYRMIFKSFQDKYFAIPGDMSNATAFWGTLTTCASGGLAAAGLTQTCDGNGNGIVEGGALHEYEKVWQHLAISGFIAGDFKGKIQSGTPAEFPRLFPPAKLGGYLGFSYLGEATGNALRFTGSYGHALSMGKAGLSSGILTPAEMYSMDTKLDDGKPALGSLRVISYPNLGVCTDTTDFNNTSANYLMTDDSSVNCNLIFPHAR